MNDFNDLIINTEAGLLRNRLDRALLINQSFVLWYILVEGIVCENFAESDIKDMFHGNIRTYLRAYKDNADFNFIVGWMLTVAFWHFDPLLKEEDGVSLLNSAYRANTKNSLFKWALRKVFGLSGNEIRALEIDIASRFDQFYNYGDSIRDYFLDVI
ncbi:MAG: hypothetical protein Q8927_20655 [Bacteroidota bacterium]|nr:hypothetical protein [Bacteroidota bacterium]MDP4245682.1 hypothetical protein [Bacteroidota bacterium]MDP4259918.1 hypothetical protein [Bacteroidota bacterium]